MIRLRRAMALTLVLLAVPWLLSNAAWPQPLNWFSFRTPFVQWTGVLAIGAMAVAMLLALRPKRIEPAIGGLDKMYRLHKWLGITALVASVLHWWWAQGTKWMVGWGWLLRPPRGPRPDSSQLGTVEAFFRGQRGLAEAVGEYAFYAAAALMLLALLRRVPYHWFRATHRWLAPVFLLLAWHAVVLLRFDDWRAPVGVLLALLLAGGALAAVVSIRGRIGAGRRVAGTITGLRAFPSLDVLASTVRLAEGWPGHAAGQFAFVTSDRREGAHPYTIASAWDPSTHEIRFISKALGDHTRRLPQRLAVGLPVTVEGPYGCFDFDDGRARQVWIGAGIGITPFIARLQQRARRAEAVEVDLYHPTAVVEPQAIALLDADARAAGVRLHVVGSGHGPRLDGARIRQEVPGWREASVWFCGPAAFGEALRRDLVAHGLPASAFHQELFEMR